MALSGNVNVTRAQGTYFSWTTDILIYIVVLNLFVEYVDTIVIESFTVSILVAILLKAMLVVIDRVARRVYAWFSQREGRIYLVIAVLAAEAIIFTSKILILIIVDLIFEEDVMLGGLIEIIALVIAMMGARYLMRWIYLRLGSGNGQPQQARSV